MKKLTTKIITRYVEENIGTFHKNRIDCLHRLKLQKVLKRKNPYLFKAKNCLTPDEIVKGITDAYLSSNEETIFGNWLEGLAIYINQLVYNGRKSTTKGIDLEFDKDSIRYIINIKSGPNWGNSSQISKMKTDFTAAKRTIRTSNSKLHIIAVNGCCYGTEKYPDKGDYYKYCGQEFWEFISGEENLYKDIIEPLEHKAKDKNDLFLKAYSQTITIFLREFINDFCKQDGQIDWDKLVEFNSGKM